MNEALKSLEAYSRYVANLMDQFAVEKSTVTVWSISKYMGIAEGEIFIGEGYRLRIREEIDFAEGWYDDFPHPNDPTLAETHPHHKHVPPNIKRNRIPAPNMKFERNYSATD